jgi:hypothetical protein
MKTFRYILIVAALLAAGSSFADPNKDSAKATTTHEAE